MKIRVKFTGQGLQLAGILFVPDTYTGERLPAVVVGHPGSGVKEQTASVYAELLSREGFAALAFDAAYQGESEGEPRGLEDPFQRAEDVRSAVSHLTTRRDIDPGRIGALGICASVGYAPFAAQTDRRIKAVATVSAPDIGTGTFEGLGKTQDPATVRDVLLEQAGALRNAEARGEGPIARNNFPSLLADVTSAPARTMWAEAYDYYLTPRQPPACQQLAAAPHGRTRPVRRLRAQRLDLAPSAADDRGHRRRHTLLQRGRHLLRHPSRRSCT